MTAQTASLGDVAEFVNGVAFKEDDWGDQGRPIIRIQNLNDPGKPFNRTVRRVADRNLARKGDLLVSWAASLGVYEWNGEEACINQHIFKVIPDATRVDQQYLRRALEASLGHMERESHGATMKHITRDRFLGIPIQLPSISEQRRIAAILGKADALRAKRREAIAKLDQLLQSVFLDMFGDPATNAWRWPVRALGQVLSSAEVFTDGDWVESKDQDPDGAVRLVQLADVGDGFYVNKSRRYLTKETALRLRCTFLRTGDVLVARMPDPLGRACIFPGDERESVTVVDVCVIRPGVSGPDPQWLAACINSSGVRSQIEKMATGTTRSRISRGNLAKVQVIDPPRALQDEFARAVVRIESTRARLVDSRRSMDTLFTALQQQAFSGAL